MDCTLLESQSIAVTPKSPKLHPHIPNGAWTRLAHILDHIHLCFYAAKPTSTTQNMALPSLLGNVFVASPQYAFLWARWHVHNTEHHSYPIKG